MQKCGWHERKLINTVLEILGSFENLAIIVGPTEVRDAYLSNIG